MKYFGFILNVLIFIGFFATNQPLSFGQVTISPTSSITVKEGSSLFIGTDLYLKANDTSSGHLCDQNILGEIIISGDVTVERYLSANSWHNTSSPISSGNSSIYSGTDLVFYYDESIIENDWDFGWVFYDGPLAVMKGYDVFLPVTPITATYTTNDADFLNTGTYSIGVTRTNVANGEIESHKGWNLVGNPYPSPLDWLEESGWDKTTIVDAKYIWDPVNDNYTIFLGGAVPVGLNGGTRFIPSNQGFWVQATQTGTLEVNNAARRGLMEDTPNFYKNEWNNSFTYLFRAEANGYSDETMIRFSYLATDGFDAGYDASKLSHGVTKSPQISSKCRGNNMAVNTMSAIVDNMAVPISFTHPNRGPCILKLINVAQTDDFTEVYLKDILETNLINLKTNPVYSFYHDPNNSAQRFLIYFNPSTDIKNSINENNAFSIYAYKNTIFVIRNTSMILTGDVRIYDALGKCIARKPLAADNHFNFEIQSPAGYYFVRVITDEYQKASKLWISQ